MTNRVERVNSLIKDELSKILVKEEQFSSEVLVTITRVDTSPDLNQAKVFIAVIPSEKKKEVLDFLSKQAYFLQQKLNQRLKMRKIPKIILKTEEKTEEADRIEKILKDLEK